MKHFLCRTKFCFVGTIVPSIKKIIPHSKNCSNFLIFTANWYIGPTYLLIFGSSKKETAHHSLVWWISAELICERRLIRYAVILGWVQWVGRLLKVKKKSNYRKHFIKSVFPSSLYFHCPPSRQVRTPWEADVNFLGTY